MIVAAASKAGCPLSTLPCVQTKTELFEHLRFEWSAFWSLHSDRQIGMALGPISWASIDRFALRYGLVQDDFDRFCRVIQAMDEAYRIYHEKK